MRTKVLLIAILALAATPAQAQAPRVVKLVAGRTYLKATPTRANTKIEKFVIWGMAPGSTVAVTCVPSPCAVPDATATAGASGIVDVARVRSKKLPAGFTLVVKVTAPNGYVDRLAYTAKPNAFSTFRESCATPDGTETACKVTCGVDAPADRCSEATGVIATRISWASLTRGKRTKLVGLTYTDVQPGTTIAVLCSGSPCPFGISVRYFADAVPRFNFGAPLIGRLMKPGSVVEAWAIRADQIGKVFRLVNRARQAPREQKLCVYPAEGAPRGCP